MFSIPRNIICRTFMCRDCVGAIQLLPENEAPTDLYEIRGEILSVAEIAQLLRNTTSTLALGQHDHGEDLRLSIAGAQEKTALLYHKGRWLLPHEIGRAHV